jgi:Tfp pilus assembly protein PilV
MIRFHERRGGWMLLEAMIALTLLTVGVLGFMFTFQSNFKATQEIGNRDLAYEAFESAVETLRAANFSTLCATYQGAKLPAKGLYGTDGNQATVAVKFDVNETTLPMAYGPVSDLDGDGVMMTSNVSASYMILPTCLTLTYKVGSYFETKVMYLVLAP